MIDIKKLYNHRFTHFERIRKQELWKILCQDFLQQFVKKDETVVDVGAGNCEFINNINCGKKIAVDINNETLKMADKDVLVIIHTVKELKQIFQENSLNVIFMSNLLEHMDNKEDVFRLLNESYQILKKGGKLLIMQPDISLVGHEYWDYFDHKVPITAASLTEALYSIGFKITRLHYPFLPYTTKTKYLPMWPVLLKIYIKVPILHRIFGKQFFVCAQK